jgi:hypothetical protein
MRTKIFVTILVLMSTIDIHGQIRLGVKGGMNITNFEMSSTQGISIDFANRVTFHAGGWAEIPLGSFLSVQPELLFSAKGAKIDTSEPIPLETNWGTFNVRSAFEFTFSPFYVELPVFLKTNFSAGTGKIMVGVGPYLACGVGGKMKLHLDISAPLIGSVVTGEGEKKLFKTDKLDIQVTAIDGTTININDVMNDLPVDELRLFEKTPFKRFDVGITGFIGYEFEMGLFVSVGYYRGLYNVSNIDENEIQLKNKTFSLTVGYRF